MKTEPKTKLDMKNKTASKEFDDDVMSANYVIGRCQFMANLEQSGSRILDT